MATEELYASFVLDKKQGLEIALHAESVAEATPVTSRIQPLPASLDFVEGIMHLRDEAIPLINLKKRLNLQDQEYPQDAKVAVVNLFHRRYGLLFDDIHEVFGAGPSEIQMLDPALQSEDRIISALIARERGVRTVELLELANLFPGNTIELEKMGQALAANREPTVAHSYQRYVVFSFGDQLFGLPVEYSQEITFFDAVYQMYKGGVEEEHPPFSGSILDIFKQGDIDGILSLRGKAVPVLNARRLLSGELLPDEEYLSEETRVLVIRYDGTTSGIVVEQVRNIETVPENEILPVPGAARRVVSGVYNRGDGQNIMLLDVEKLVGGYKEELGALSRLSNETRFGESEEEVSRTGAHHLITENCYLVFSVGGYMAVQLKDVQEIIERSGILGMPGETGYSSGVINLRGTVVPVINLHRFFKRNGGGGSGEKGGDERKLIICTAEQKTIALEVDSIVTIYKQEQYQNTTSLSPELAAKADMLDRLIVFDGGGTKREHVLVLNIHNLIRNHLEQRSK